MQPFLFFLNIDLSYSSSSSSSSTLSFSVPSEISKYTRLKFDKSKSFLDNLRIHNINVFKQDMDNSKVYNTKKFLELIEHILRYLEYIKDTVENNKTNKMNCRPLYSTNITLRLEKLEEKIFSLSSYNKRIYIDWCLIEDLHDLMDIKSTQKEFDVLFELKLYINIIVDLIDDFLKKIFKGPKQSLSIYYKFIVKQAIKIWGSAMYPKTTITSNENMSKIQFVVQMKFFEMRFRTLLGEKLEKERERLFLTNQ